MKTAEQIARLLNGINPNTDVVAQHAHRIAILKQWGDELKQNAFSSGKSEGIIEGMTEAIVVCDDQKAWNETKTGIFYYRARRNQNVETIDRCTQAIETARDAKKQKLSSSFYGTTECNEDIEPDTKKD